MPFSSGRSKATSFMVSTVSVLKGCHSVWLLLSLFSNELLGHMFCLFMYSLSPRQWEARIPWLKSIMLRGVTPWMSPSLELWEVIGAGLVPWHVLTASQLQLGNVSWAGSLAGRECSRHSAAPVKPREVSTSSVSAGRSVSSLLQGSETGHMVQRSSMQNRWRGSLCFDR